MAQNLLDAGCDAAFIHQYAQLKGLPEQLLLLRKHRRTLRDRIHEEQHRLDCLDYFVYSADVMIRGNEDGVEEMICGVFS